MEMERPEEEWITAAEAAALLNVTPGMVNQYARWGTLARVIRGRDQNHRANFRRAEVEALAERRAAERAACALRQKGKSLEWWGNRAKRPAISDDDVWITAQEAADILGVTPARVYELVDHGQLFAYQEKPGQQRSRLWLSANMVGRLAQREERLRRRAAWEKGRTESSEWSAGWEERDIAPVRRRAPGSATERNYGDF
jgi:predicted transcriptional regulator